MTPIVRTPAIALERFDHAPGVAHHDPEQEQADGHALNFVEAGSFRLRVDGRWHTLDRTQVFATGRGLEFRCAHGDMPPDDVCLSVRYSDEAIESLLSAGAAPIGAPVLPLTNRRAYLKLELARAADLDATGAEAIAGALYFSLAGVARSRTLFRSAQLAWYAARISRAKSLMRARYAEPLSLSLLARDAGMSLYHFARVFSELEDQPPHRYLLRIRLAAAASRLRAGAGVTETCFAVGFGSLSHFVSSFRRHMGVRPSDFAEKSAGS